MRAKETWSADADARARVARGIESRIAKGVWRARIFKLGAVGAMVAAATGALWLTIPNQPPAISMHKAARAAAQVISAPTLASDPPSERVGDFAPHLPVIAPGHARRATRTEDVLPTTEESPPGVSDELSLIREADQALRSNSIEHAHELLLRHEREFPNGVLAEEREGLRIIERCTTLQSPLSATLAFDFIARHPRSPLRERIERLCGN